MHRLRFLSRAARSVPWRGALEVVGLVLVASAAVLVNLALGVFVAGVLMLLYANYGGPQ